MKIKIRNSADAPNLCDSCSYAHVVTFDNQEKYTYCKGLLGLRDNPQLVTKKVIKCSTYDEEKGVSLWDMRQICWILRTDRAGRLIGFTPYRDADEKTRQEIQEMDEL